MHPRPHEPPPFRGGQGQQRADDRESRGADRCSSRLSSPARWPPPPPPAAAPSRPQSGPAGLLPAAATIVGVALLLRLVHGPWYLNYDARYALLWARDLVRGHTPEYTADFAPTPHPLETAVSVLATPFGDGGDPLMLWLILLCFGLLVWLTYRLGAELFSPWAGVVAALVVLDAPGAGARRAARLPGHRVRLRDRRRRCCWRRAAPAAARPCCGLLVLAGLMRPEAWVLAGLYFLWMWPAADTARRLRLAAMVAAAPLLWALSRPARHRRRAALAARHGRPRRGRRPPPRRPRRALLDRAVLRLHAARAARDRHPDRPLLRLAPPPAARRSCRSSSSRR